MRNKLLFRSIKLYFDQKNSYFEIGVDENSQNKNKYYLTDFGEGRQVTRWGAQNLLFAFMVMLFDGYLRDDRVDFNYLWENFLYDAGDEEEDKPSETGLDRKPENPLKRGIKILMDSVFISENGDLNLFSIEGKHNYSFNNGEEKQLDNLFLYINIDGKWKNGEPLEECKMMRNYFGPQWEEIDYINALEKKNNEIIDYFDEHINEYDTESNLNYWYTWRKLLTGEKLEKLEFKKGKYEKQKLVNKYLFPVVKVKEIDEAFPSIESYIQNRIKKNEMGMLVSLVTGDGGGGKSFGLINAYNSLYDYEKDSLFIFIPAFGLQEFKPNEDPVFSFITDRYIHEYQRWGRKITKREAFLLCSYGKKIILVIDGIDEISSDYYGYIWESIRELEQSVNVGDLTKSNIIISMRESNLFLRNSCIGLENKINIEEVKLQRLSQINIDRLEISNFEIRKTISKNEIFQTPLFLQMFIEISEGVKKNNATTNLKKHYASDIVWNEYEGVELKFDTEWEVFMAWNNIMLGHAQRNTLKENVLYSNQDVYKWLLPLASYRIAEDYNLKDKGIPIAFFGDSLSNFIIQYKVFFDKENVRLPEEENKLKALINTGIIHESNLAGEYEYKHNKYSKFFAAKFVLDVVNKDNVYGKEGSLGKPMLEKLISGTRYYEEKEKELDRASKLVYMEYAAYTFDMICKIVKEKSSELKKDLLLLGLNIGYEDTFDVWNEVIELIKWYEDNENEIKDRNTINRVLIGINSFLYSYVPKDNGRYVEEILLHYQWLIKKVNGMEEEVCLFETFVSSNLGATYLQLAKNNNNEKNISERDRYLGINDERKIIKKVFEREEQDKKRINDYGNAAGQHDDVREKRKNLRKRIIKGEKIIGLDGNEIGIDSIPLSKADANLATDYFWKAIWIEKGSENDINTKIKCFEKSIEYHKDAMELQGLRIKEYKTGKIKLEKIQNKSIFEVAPIDGKSYMILRRIAGNYREISQLKSLSEREKYIKLHFYTLQEAYRELDHELKDDSGNLSDAMVRINGNEIRALYKDIMGREPGHENLFANICSVDKMFQKDVQELSEKVEKLYERL